MYKVTKTFKTKLPRKERDHIFALGAAAARDGWERYSPISYARGEQDWFDGFDSVKTG